LMSKIKKMSVDGVDGKVTISLIGQEIELSGIEDAVKNCNISC